jgi:hypothetical protein
MKKHLSEPQNPAGQGMPSERDELANMQQRPLDNRQDDFRAIGTRESDKEAYDDDYEVEQDDKMTPDQT